MGQYRSPASTAFWDWRQAAAAHEVGRRAAGFDSAGATTAKNLGGTGNGGDSAAPLRTGRAGELRGDAVRENSGQFELYGVERNTRVVRGAMQTRNGDHDEAAAGEDSARSPGQGDPSRGSGCFTNDWREADGAAAVVSAGLVAGAPAGRPDALTRRSGDCDFLERQHGRAEGRDADALQHRVKYRAGGADVHAGPHGLPARGASLFPLLRIHGDAVDARCAGCRSGLPPEPA